MAKVEIHKLGIIGAGVMGQAVIRGLMHHQLITVKNVWAAAKTETSCEKVRMELGIPCHTNYSEALKDTDVILLCVKPNGIHSVLEKLKSQNLPPHTLIISIVAGATIEQIETTLGAKNPVIRAMTKCRCARTPLLLSLAMGGNDALWFTGRTRRETHVSRRVR